MAVRDKEFLASVAAPPLPTPTSEASASTSASPSEEVAPSLTGPSAAATGPWPPALGLVLNMARDAPVRQDFAPITVQYKLTDHHTEDMLAVLGPATETMHMTIGQGRAVLVHCVQGVSRSAAVVIAYLIRYHDMSVADALGLVRSARTIVYPNHGFLKQLMEWEGTHRAGRPGTGSMTPDHLRIHAGLLKI